MAKTAAGLVAHAISLLGKGYVYGCNGKVVTEDLIQQLAKMYTSMYTDNYIQRCRKWIGKVAYDCSSVIDSYVGVDRNANGWLNTASQKGAIGTMPDIPGVLVHFDGHIGVYVGGGQVVEARGVDYGVVRTSLSGRGWKSWSKCPLIDYGTTASAPMPADQAFVDNETLVMTDPPAYAGTTEDETVETKDWKVFYTGEYGVKSALYLEQVRNLEVQRMRQEQVDTKRAMAEYGLGVVGVMEDDDAYTEHIDKWETILYSTPGLSALSPESTLLSGQTKGFPLRAIGKSRSAYLASVQSSLIGQDAVFGNKNYAHIQNLSTLKDIYSVSTYDRNDPWAGYARKDLLFYLYCLYQELDYHIHLRGKNYAKLMVSLCRYNETKKSLSSRQMEHYVGLAADVYLPRTSEGVKIVSETIADILHSMGIHYIGIGNDFVHFDLAGDEDNYWTIGERQPYSPKIIDLNRTKSIVIPEEFL